MCGHVGVAGDLNVSATKAFKDLIFMDALRGEDGTGIAAVPFTRNLRTPEKTEIFKTPLASYLCIQNPYFKSLIGRTSAGVLLGHNRAATLGKLSTANTHPFQTPKLVGAHNGTIQSHERRGLEVEGEFGTDSEEMLNGFSQLGVKETIESVYSGPKGAWAFVWYDYEEDSINLLRNDQRTLYYALTKDNEQLFWASESYMLRAALSRRGVEAEKISLVPQDTWLSWTVPSQGESFQTKPDRIKCAGKKPIISVVSSSSHASNYNPRHRVNYGSQRKLADLSAIALPSSFDVELQNYTDYDTTDVIKLFKDNTDCIWCHKKIHSKDLGSGKAVPVSKESAVCESCKKIPVIASSLNKRQKDIEQEDKKTA